MTAKEVVEVLKQAIDLIESQQVEINKLEKVRQKQAECLVELRGQNYELMNRMSIVKNEAYKEFAEKLNEKAQIADCFDRYNMVIGTHFIDNLLKEMVGEEE